LNAVYDGYSYMPLHLSYTQTIPFSHTWNYEPATFNHWVPNFGLFSKQYMNSQFKRSHNQDLKYSSFKKDHGPPHSHYAQLWDPIEKNEYLLKQGVDIDALRNVHSQQRIATV